MPPLQGSTGRPRNPALTGWACNDAAPTGAHDAETTPIVFQPSYMGGFCEHARSLVDALDLTLGLLQRRERSFTLPGYNMGAPTNATRSMQKDSHV